jgi:hypothetical protein
VTRLWWLEDGYWPLEAEPAEPPMTPGEIAHETRQLRAAERRERGEA